MTDQGTIRADRRAQHPAARAQAVPRAAHLQRPGRGSSMACAARSRRGPGDLPPTCPPRPAATRRRRPPACSAAARWRAAWPSASPPGPRAWACRSTRSRSRSRPTSMPAASSAWGTGFRPATRRSATWSRSTARHPDDELDELLSIGRAPQPLSRRLRPGVAAQRRPAPQRRGGLTAMDPRLQRRVQRYGWDRAVGGLRARLARPARAGSFR